jgi:hypothetical protein
MSKTVLVLLRTLTTRHCGAAAPLTGMLKQSTAQACNILSVSSLTFLGLPNDRLDSIPLLDIDQSREGI